MYRPTISFAEVFQALACCNNDAEKAIEWLMNMSNRQDFNSAYAGPSQQNIKALQAMGFSEDAAKTALLACVSI